MKHKRIVLKPYTVAVYDAAYAASAYYAASAAANAAAYYDYYILYPLLRDAIIKNNYKTLPSCYLITNIAKEMNETN